MRRMLSKFKYLKVMALSLSLLPLDSIAQCIPREETPGVVEGMISSMGRIFKRFDNSEAVARYCYMPKTFDVHSKFDKYSQIPAIPKDFEDACSCFENLGVTSSREERAANFKRLKELKYRKREFDSFIKYKRVAEDSMLAFVTLFPTREIPKTCDAVLGPEAKLEGSDTCRDDLVKLAKVQIDVEPFVLSPETQTRGIASDNNNDGTRVYLSDSYREMVSPRKAILMRKAGELARSENIDFREARSRFNDNDVTVKEIVDYHTSGVSASFMERFRNKSIGSMHEANSSLDGLDMDYQVDRVNPFGDNEVDRAAAKMLGDMIQGGTGFVNASFGKASSQSPKDLLASVRGDPEEKMRAIIKIAEVTGQQPYNIPPKPLKLPIDPNARGDERFVSPDPEDAFQRAVFDRYAQMARTFNYSNYLRANPSKVFKFDSDGVTLVPNDNLGDTLITSAQEAYSTIESARTLEAACEVATKQRQKICLERSDEDLKEEKLLPEEINTLAAADLERGDEVAYGKIVCGSFLDWRDAQHGLLRGFFGNFFTMSRPSFSDYRESRCDTSSIPQSGQEQRPLIGEGCPAVAESAPSAPPPPPDSLKTDAEIAAFNTMMASVDNGALAEQLSLVTAGSGQKTQTVAAVIDGNISVAPTSSMYGYDEAAGGGGGVAGVEERADKNDYEYFGPPVSPVYTVRPQARPTDFPTATTSVLGTTDSNLSSDIESLSSGSMLGVDLSSTDSGGFVGAVDPKNVTSSGFDVSSVFQTNVSDSGRFSIYDNIGVQTPLLPEFGDAEAEGSDQSLSASDLRRAQGVVKASDARYDELLSQYEEMKKELELIKGDKEDKETNELISELKKQIAELKNSRKDLEEKIEKEKTKRETEAALAAVRATPTQTSQSSNRNSFSRTNEANFRPAAQPTYSAEVTNVAPVKANIPVVNNAASYANQAASRRSFDDLQRTSDLSAGTLSGGGTAPSQAAIATRTTSTSTSTSSGLRLTAQAFDKLSSNDFQTLYESNQGGAIFVEKSVADGNGNRNLVVEKYVPEVIEGEIIYINQGEIAENPVAEEESVAEGPSRSIASIEAPVAVEEGAELRAIKEVSHYQETLYSPIHQQLIDRIQAAVAEGRQ